MNYTKLNKDKIDNEKMKKDIFERFKWNIEHNDEENEDKDELDPNHLTNIYSNFKETVLL